MKRWCGSLGPFTGCCRRWECPGELEPLGGGVIVHVDGRWSAADEQVDPQRGRPRLGPGRTVLVPRRRRGGGLEPRGARERGEEGGQGWRRGEAAAGRRSYPCGARQYTFKVPTNGAPVLTIAVYGECVQGRPACAGPSVTSCVPSPSRQLRGRERAVADAAAGGGGGGGAGPRVARGACPHPPLTRTRTGCLATPPLPPPRLPRRLDPAREG